MLKPTFSDYVTTIRHLFDEYQQQSSSSQHRGRKQTYQNISLILFFTLMTLRRIFKFKAQHRWLENHPQYAEVLGFAYVPHRVTLSRRYKKLYETVQGFVQHVGEWSENLDEAFLCNNLFADKSLFKAKGPVWHQKDRKAGIIPKGLRNLDTQASWGKSAYHGWVYGYALHSVCTQSGFPKMVQVETASISESSVIDQKADEILLTSPETLTADDGYSNLKRVKNWAEKGVALLTPALRSKQGIQATSYHAYIQREENATLLSARKTAIEPLFDLVSKVLSTEENHKQLPVQGKALVRTLITLGIMIVQIAMILNSVWGLPLHNISQMISVFT